MAVGLAADVSNSLPAPLALDLAAAAAQAATMRRLAFELLITAKTQRRPGRS